MVFLLALWACHEYDKRQAVQSIKNEYIQKSKDVFLRAERATQALEASHRLDMKEKDEKINVLNSNLNSAIASLQHRPVRPSIVTVTKIRESCSGAQLYREDAEFLTREAARADKALIDRDFYYSEYEKARRKLEELHD